MKILNALLLGCIGLSALPAIADDFVVVHAGRLMAVPGEPVTAEQSVVIRNGKIVEVLPGYVGEEVLTDKTSKDSVTFHDLKQSFVLPGLIDGHVHILSEFGPRNKIETVERSDADIAMFGARNAKITLAAGFTTVRDLNARGTTSIYALRDAIKKGYVDGPRLFAAGHAISPTGGHAQPHGYSEEVFDIVKTTSICDGADDCRRAVRDQIRRSADHIKFVATGGVTSETATGTGQQFTDAEIKAIVETAHALGRKVTAHAHGIGGIKAALRAGVDSVEHATFTDKEAIRLFRKSGAYLVPTLLTVDAGAAMAKNPKAPFSDAVREKALKVSAHALKALGRAHEAGVKFAFGTDSAVLSKHGTNAKEFELLVGIGMTPVEAIKTATVNGADNLGKSDVLGSLEPGKYADLIAVDGDPTVDVGELRDVDFVMKEGVVYKGL